MINTLVEKLVRTHKKIIIDRIIMLSCSCMVFFGLTSVFSDVMAYISLWTGIVTVPFSLWLGNAGTIFSPMETRTPSRPVQVAAVIAIAQLLLWFIGVLLGIVLLLMVHHW